MFLETHLLHMQKLTLNELFAENKKRFAEFSLQANGMLFDYSKQLITNETIGLLCSIAKKSDLSRNIARMFAGEIVNITEHRPALHSELRNPKTSKTEITDILNKMSEFVDTAKNKYKDIIVLGIGGSDLGPRLVCEALKPYKSTEIRLHFVANVDGDTLLPLLDVIDPANTACIINSKTFTTIETLANAKIVRSRLGDTNIFGVTSNKEAAVAWGIDPDNIFEFWDWVGGRFSVWSAVGLPIALSIGMENFRRFLDGAHQMDQHFKTAEFDKNMPVLMALIGIWNINYLNYTSLAIMPYADGLQLLPAYLQQLEMESNGKPAAQQTAPVIWGGVGCNGQHAYMQLLHQGTQVVPVDFFLAKHNHVGEQHLQDLLVASCLGQSQALMQGRKSSEAYKVCDGNRPSSTLMFEKLTPEIVGNIIALYEHKVFVQGVMWGIDSFDQWGVQLGKDLIKEVLQVVDSGDAKNLDSSTAGLINYYRS